MKMRPGVMGIQKQRSAAQDQVRERVLGHVCRYFAEAVGTLLCAVNGKRERQTPLGRSTDYWLSDGAHPFAPHLAR